MEHVNEFVDRVFIIDNLEEEIKPLKEILEKLDIAVTVYNPNDDEEEKNVPTLFKNRQLIFADLMLDENEQNAKSNISKLVHILCQAIPNASFNPYGLVVWTKHEDYIESLKNVLNTALYTKDNAVNPVVWGQDPIKLHVPPMFIISLDKTKYMKDGYDSLLDDLKSVLKESLIGDFFMNWIVSVRKAINKSILEIQSVCKDVAKQDDYISYVLYRLAKNHTGALEGDIHSLTVDSYKAFDELLYADLFVAQKAQSTPVFSDKINNPLDPLSIEYKKMIAGLNSKMFLDFDAISKDVIVPGNIYNVKQIDYCLLEKDQIDTEYIDLEHVKEMVSPQIIKKDEDEEISVKDVRDKYFEVKNIAIELTPPCDFANKKVMSRIVSGYAFKYPVNFTSAKKEKMFKEQFKKEYQYVLRNVLIGEDIYWFVFNFHYLFGLTDDMLRNEGLFTIWGRAKPKLFSDILQKFSSHASRLGISNLEY